jgi:hypothetical protein
MASPADGFTMSRLLFSLSVATLALAAVTSTACTHRTTVIVRTPERVVFETKCIDTECEAGRRAASRSKACKDCIGAWVDGRAYDESTRCGFQPNDDDITRINAECTKAALTNTDAAVAYYAAFETDECGELPLSENLSEFGAELCAIPAGSCLASCHDPNHGSLDALGDRLKPALLDGARACMGGASCDEVNRCIDAWRTLFL